MGGLLYGGFWASFLHSSGIIGGIIEEIVRNFIGLLADSRGHRKRRVPLKSVKTCLCLHILGIIVVLAFQKVLILFFSFILFLLLFKIILSPFFFPFYLLGLLLQLVNPILLGFSFLIAFFLLLHISQTLQQLRGVVLPGEELLHEIVDIIFLLELALEQFLGQSLVKEGVVCQETNPARALTIVLSLRQLRDFAGFNVRLDLHQIFQSIQDSFPC